VPKPDNANYLWIQLFYSALAEKGRAGFVMANSAGDAGHSEREIVPRVRFSARKQTMPKHEAAWCPTHTRRHQ
jgi:hypothetical protein